MKLTAIAFCVASMSGVIQAAENSEKHELNPVVVTATRTAHTIQEATASIDTISSKDIETRAPVNFEELFTDLPNVSVSDFGFMSNSISIRGSAPITTTYLIDGVRQDFTAKTGLMPTGIFIDPEMLKFVEVKHGGGSSLYGNGGIGGTIAVTTKTAADFLEGTDKNYGATVKAGFSSDSLEWHESLFGYGRGDVWDAVFGISRRDSGNVRFSNTGKRSDSNRDGDFTSVLAKGTLFTGENSQLSLTYNYDEQNLTWGKQSLTDYQYKQHRLTGAWNYEDGKYINLKSAIQYVHSDYNYNIGYKATNKFDSFSGNIQNTSLISAFGNHAITYGGDLSQTKQSGEDNSLGPMVSSGSRPDSEGYDAGIFIQDEYALNQYITAIPVLRWNYYKRESNNGYPSIDDSKLTPGFTVKITPIDNLSFWGSVSNGYRPPILDELYLKILYPESSDPDPKGLVVDPNPNLKPEKSTNWELGMSAEGKSILSQSDKAQGKVTLFYDQVKDFITNTFPAKLGPDHYYHISLINLGKVTKKGVEITGIYETGPLTFNASYGYLHVKDEETGEKVKGIAPQTAKLRTSWKIASQNLELWHRAYWSHGGISYDSDARTDKDYGGFVTHAVGILWEPKMSGFASFTVGASVENLFNKKYNTLGTEYSGSNYGRGVRVWATGRF